MTFYAGVSVFRDRNRMRGPERMGAFGVPMSAAILSRIDCTLCISRSRFYTGLRRAREASRRQCRRGIRGPSGPFDGWRLRGIGGEGGIRTPDTVTRMPHFECGAFNHSATSPQVWVGAWSRCAFYPRVARNTSNPMLAEIIHRASVGQTHNVRSEGEVMPCQPSIGSRPRAL